MKVRTVACHAVRGDGTINCYRGPVGPRAEKAIRLVNENIDEMLELDGPADPNDEVDGEICEIETEDELIETLVWWANDCPDDEDDYEYKPELD